MPAVGRGAASSSPPSSSSLSPDSLTPRPSSSSSSSSSSSPSLVEEWRDNTGYGTDDEDEDLDSKDSNGDTNTDTNTGMRNSMYWAELDTMSSPEMRAAGVEILDAASMLAFRGDAHTVGGVGGAGEGSDDALCLPGPLDDVNSLLLNRLCYGDNGDNGEGA